MAAGRILARSCPKETWETLNVAVWENYRGKRSWENDE